MVRIINNFKIQTIKLFFLVFFLGIFAGIGFVIGIIVSVGVWRLVSGI